MANLIYEKRSFKDPRSGITTEYDYFAIKGGTTHQYEISLKNLVQSEKEALKMMYNMENPEGITISTKSSTSEEKESFLKKNNSNNLFDDGELD